MRTFPCHAQLSPCRRFPGHFDTMLTISADPCKYCSGPHGCWQPFRWQRHVSVLRDWRYGKCWCVSCRIINQVTPRVLEECCLRLDGQPQCRQSSCDIIGMADALHAVCSAHLHAKCYLRLSERGGAAAWGEVQVFLLSCKISRPCLPQVVLYSRGCLMLAAHKPLVHSMQSCSGWLVCCCRMQLDK